jgi:hypothetical protein
MTINTAALLFLWATFFLSRIEVVVDAQLINNLFLINTDTNTNLGPIKNGTIIRLNEVGSQITIRASVVRTKTSSVIFDMDGIQGVQLENTAPYTLAGDTIGLYYIAKINDGKTTEDINEQEKVLARNEKKEPPRKRLDISATPQQFASGSQKKYPEKIWQVMGPELFKGLTKPRTAAPMTPQRNNTIQQKNVTTSSEFNNECDNIMNDDEDKDRKMRGRPGDTGSSGQCG